MLSVRSRDSRKRGGTPWCGAAPPWTARPVEVVPTRTGMAGRVAPDMKPRDGHPWTFAKRAVRPARPPLEQAKRCPRCTKTLPRGEFYKAKSSYDGCHSICKVCTRAAKRALYLRRKAGRPVAPRGRPPASKNSDDLEESSVRVPRIERILQEHAERVCMESAT